MVLYALSHEKDLLYRPLRQGMGLPEEHIPALKLQGTMRAHFLREIFDAIFYVLKSGYPRRLVHIQATSCGMDRCSS
jgi:hypothetical protein